MLILNIYAEIILSTTVTQYRKNRSGNRSSSDIYMSVSVFNHNILSSSNDHRDLSVLYY